MEVESSICLSDLVPALRWSRPQQVAEALGDPRLPAGWWSSLALSKALGMAGLDWICERLARLAFSRWDHLPLIDLLPALTVHQVDPALPGWPEATRTAITGLGGWQRLRRLSPSDLSTPSATPEVVIGSIFREILGRIPVQRQAGQPDHPEVTRPLQRDATPAQDETTRTGPQPQTGSFAAQSGPFAPAQGGSPAARPEGPARQPQTAGPFAAAQGDGPPQRQNAGFPGQPPERPASSFPAADAGSQHQTAPPSDGGRPTGSVPAQQESGPQRQAGSFPAQPESGPQRQTGSFPAQPESGPQRQTGSFPAQPQGGGSPRQGHAGESGLPQRPGQPERLPQRPAGPQPGRQDTGSLPRIPTSGGPVPGGPSTGSFPAIPGGPSTGSFPAVPGRPSTGSLPAVPGGPSTGSFPAVPGRPSTGSFPAIPGGPSTGSLPAVPGGDTSKGGAPRTPAYPTPGTASAGPVPSDTDHAMVRVVDNLFRGLDKLELAVAVHRLFAEDPVSLRTLAHKMLVERDALSHAQRTAEERVLHWLRSSESAPVTGHMFRLTEWLGAAATEDQLIGADPAHPVTVPSLRTPLWRVLVTLMPDRRLQDGWLVVGDIHGLQARTRQLLASSPPDADVVELMAELGIRAHSAKAWLDALPSETAPDPVASSQSPAQPLPRRTPGANGHHHRGGQPIPPATTASIDPSAALATLSALSGGRSGMLPVAGAPATPPPPLPSPSSDPRRWQRIEVTPEHLRGGPVPVPEGYAAQLGMRPGTLLSVTGPGDNAIVLVWQGHQPVFDSLQPVLMRLNARPGDQVYVTVDGYRLEAQLTA
ncbi:hypothetical protein [Nonomuraea turcica]|uniref:hypothetical protein n=1 Tax=Nonomuraea sp. G32 TaxID=3067274 RepID=UPI00273C9299|nr:hypothetical protein [Nonomuraea sp. G32]MDP4508238.1 hypothetical protein [Nonomuraea sp. G32]